MDRRRFVALVGSALAAPLASFAQPQRSFSRVGFLVSETLAGQANRIDALRAGLRDLGYVEGKSIAIEYRPADGNYDRLHELAAELVRLKVDLIVAFGSKAVHAAKGATTTIPIVVPSSGDPVGMGVVSGLSHPGGNITGIAMFGPETAAKRVELLKEAVPRIARVGMLMNAANPSSRPTFEAARANAAPLKLDMRIFEMRSAKDFGGVFAAMSKERIDAVAVSQDTLFRAHAKEIADLAEKRRLPAVGTKEFADAGGLIGYGVDDAGLYRRAAYFVDRILKGAKPADLPIERPTQFELVINLKTAKAIGVAIPQSVLLRADRVIE
jgi:putative tryptophan/tyrosine transport system substrate-binding protein